MVSAEENIYIDINEAQVTMTDDTLFPLKQIFGSSSKNFAIHSSLSLIDLHIVFIS